jgi:aryl-alcohol dehydrogenase-like predicted oxidoreductase
VTNARAALTDADVAAVVEEALARGVSMADTHRTTDPRHGYGRALSRLRPWASRFRITTKVFGGPSANLPALAQLEATLEELGVPADYACLVHNWSTLTDAEATIVAAALAEAVEQGLATRIGVSTYDAAELERAERVFGGLSAVQVPVSPLDQRLCGTAVVDRLAKAGVEVQVRSVFLQGLLLDPAVAAPLAAHPDVRAFHRFCADRNLDPLAVCPSFARSLPWADPVVVGVTSAAELAQIADGWAAEPIGGDWTALASDDVDLVDPRRWRR